MSILEITRPSYVYLLRAGLFFKIGKSDKVSKRIGSIQTANPSKVMLVAKFKCDSSDEARKLEKELHKRYKDRKVSGEWFSFTKEELDLVKEYGKLKSGKLPYCPVCFKGVEIKGRYIFKNGTEHIGAYCKSCKKFHYLGHHFFQNIRNIPIVKSNLPITH